MESTQTSQKSRIGLYVSTDRKDELQARAQREGLSVNSLILGLLWPQRPIDRLTTKQGAYLLVLFGKTIALLQRCLVYLRDNDTGASALERELRSLQERFGQLYEEIALGPVDR